MRLIAAACLALAGCGSGPETATRNDAAASFEPPVTRRPDPIPGQAQSTPLGAYVGHNPNDPVNGVNFFDRTEVASALEDAVTDAELRRTVVRAEGPSTPVFRVGNRLASWGCAAHDCANHHWTLLIDPATGKGELCVRRNGRTLWHAGGPPVARAGGCPSEQG